VERWGLALVPLLLVGCLPEITLPECSAVTDCPACEGFASCREGRCFKFGSDAGWNRFDCGEKCLGSEVISALDECCPGRTDQAQTDPDCGGTSIPLDGATFVSDPSVRGDDVLVVVADEQGGLSLVTVSPSSQSSLALPATLSADSGLHVPVVTDSGAVLIASQTGVCKVSADGDLLWDCDQGAPPTLPPLPLTDERVIVAAGDTLQLLGGGGDALLEKAAGGTLTSLARRGARWYAVTDLGAIQAWKAEPTLELEWSTDLFNAALVHGSG
jgi:hypothetical protein